jgi:hypothetical protein
METRATRRPGQKGTLKHLDQYGDRLLFVRYRYNSETHTRLTTVELIVDERPPRTAHAGTIAAPAPALSAASASVTSGAAKAARRPGIELTAIRIEAREKALREKVRAAGGYWDPGRGTWILRADRVRILGLQSRLVTPDRADPAT